MSRKRGPWGKRGQRIYATGGDPNVRAYEDDECERQRQEQYARAHVREDGEHYLTAEATASLESGERLFEELGKQQLSAWSAIPDVLRIAWRSVWHMGMYSSDPTLARMAMVHTAQEQIGVQRQMAAQQRLEDQAREEERAKMLARAMVTEMRAEMRRQEEQK